MKKKSDLGKSILLHFVPSGSIDYIDELVQQFRVNFKVVNPRKTKLGDCRYPLPGKNTITITINSDLPKLQFLITTIHELAHAKTYREFLHKATPHGKEWKNNYRLIFQPLLQENILKKEDIEIINHMLSNLSASSCSNARLNDHLYKDDASVTFLKDIEQSTVFELNKRQFKIIEKARTRYLCKEIKTGKKFKIHGLANVTLID